MLVKRVICPDRVRKPPAQFSWLDHRLVQDAYLDRCNVTAAALYLFLAIVADAQGLSYYSDATLARRLSIAPAQLREARSDLMRVGLIAYAAPLYQVLALDLPGYQSPDERAKDQGRAALDQMRAMMGKRHD